MTAFKNVALLASLAATSVGLTAGVAPASAARAQSGATLYIFEDPAIHTNYRVTIKGLFPMEQADAVGYLNNINDGKCEGGMSYHVHGDDGDPQHIVTKVFHGAHSDPEGYLRATPEGLEYLREIPLRKGFLNEDDGTDEIYAQAIFLDSDCISSVQTTQVLTGEF
jgi:hypothetical protein